MRRWIGPILVSDLFARVGCQKDARSIQHIYEQSKRYNPKICIEGNETQPELLIVSVPSFRLSCFFLVNIAGGASSTN